MTPFGDELRLAGTLELSGMNTRILPNRLDGIQNGVARFLSGVAGAERLAIWRGLRPMTPDGLPVIGRSPRHDNLIVATGHCMSGVMYGPGTGRLVAQLVAGESPSIDLWPLRVDRFPSLARLAGLVAKSSAAHLNELRAKGGGGGA